MVVPFESYVSWIGLPGDELGTYQVRATQGSLAATGSFELVPAEGHVLAIRESWALTAGDYVPRGNTIHIGVAGFRPAVDVDLLIYYGRHKEDGQGRFIGAVPLVTDRFGEALYVLKTKADDPPGCYAVRSRPEVDVDARDAFYLFCLR